MHRRLMIKNIVTGLGSILILPTVIHSCKDELQEPGNGNKVPADNNSNELVLDLSDPKYSNLVSDGGYIIESNIIVINAGGGFIALSSICTHQGCDVYFDPVNSNLPCPCHGSVFNTSGSVLKGPAMSPLRKYTLTLDGDLLTIYL